MKKLSKILMFTASAVLAVSFFAGCATTDIPVQEGLGQLNSTTQSLKQESVTSKVVGTVLHSFLSR